MYEAPAHERGWFALLGERLLELELLVQVMLKALVDMMPCNWFRYTVLRCAVLRHAMLHCRCSVYRKRSVRT